MKDVNRPDLNVEKKPSKVKRALVVILVTVLLLSAGCCGAVYILLRGPFDHAAAAFVQDVGQTPVGDVVLNALLTEQERALLMSIDPGTGIAEGEEKLFSVYPNLG